MKRLLGSDLCSQLLFIHAFTGCDTTRIFCVGKQTAFQKLVNGESTILSCPVQCVSAPTSSKECHRGSWGQGNGSDVWRKEYLFTCVTSLAVLVCVFCIVVCLSSLLFPLILVAATRCPSAIGYRLHSPSPLHLRSSTSVQDWLSSPLPRRQHPALVQSSVCPHLKPVLFGL